MATPVTRAQLEQASQNCDHINELATSTALSATDRLGRSKKTMEGCINTIATITVRGDWASATAYQVKDVVKESGAWYICVQAHTSGGTFSDDPDSWRVYQGVTAADLSSNGDGFGADMVGHSYPFDSLVAPAYLPMTSDILNGLPVSIMGFVPKSLHSTIRDKTTSADVTAYIQKAYDSEAGDLYHPRGLFLISQKVVFPGGRKYFGAGGTATRMAKHADFAAANPDGDVMFVSKDWDTATAYNGAANFVWEDISFDEGNHSQTFGDCLALGHAANGVVNRCLFLGLRYHGVDVTGCKNITVSNCRGIGTMNQSFAFLQVDQAKANAIKGINADDTACEGILFADNWGEGFSLASASTEQSGMYHIHRGGHKNIEIRHKYSKSCGYLLYTDTGYTGLEDIRIYGGVHLRGTVATSSAVGIYLPSPVLDFQAHDMRFYNMNLWMYAKAAALGTFSNDFHIHDLIGSATVNSPILLENVYGANVHDCVDESSGAQRVSGAYRFLGCVDFTAHDLKARGGQGDGVVVGTSSVGNVSADGEVHHCSIRNGATGYVCTDASTNNVKFWANKAKGTFTTAEKNINQDLSGVRWYNDAGYSATGTLVEAGFTGSANRAVTVTGARLGDQAVWQFSAAIPAGVVVSAAVTASNTVIISIYDPSGAAMIPAGTWTAAVVKS